MDKTNFIIFLVLLGLYSGIQLSRIIYSRYFANVTRVVIRDEENNLIPNRRIHIVVLTNEDFNMTIEDENEEDIPQCSICHDTMTTNVIKTECGHKYHKSCLISWLGANQRRSLKCPICVRSLSL